MQCVVWPDEELQFLSSSARPFKCNLCETAEAVASPSEAVQPSNDTGPCVSRNSSPSFLRRVADRRGPQPQSQAGDLGAEAAGLRALLTDALNGISFLSDQVAGLRDDNDQLRWENGQNSDSLRQE